MVTAILVFIAATAAVGLAIFTFFGGYWFHVWQDGLPKETNTESPELKPE